MFSLLRADLLRWCSPGASYQSTEWSTRRVVRVLMTDLGTWAVVDYRFRSRIRTLPPPFGPPIKVVGAVSRKAIEILTGISISSRAEIGAGLYIGHFSGIVVGRGVRIGENCNLSQGVTIGSHRGAPVIGDFVYIAPGAKVFGPISIGDHAKIGANAVVRRSVPPFSTVFVGEPVVIERPAGDGSPAG